MTKATIRVALVALSATILLPGCALKKMKKKADTISYEMVPEYLQVHGDSVKVTINGALPRKYFNKRAIMDLTPYIEYNGERTDLKGFMLKGEKVVGDGTLITKKEGGSFTYVDITGYKPAMKEAVLKLDVVGKRKAKQLEFQTFELGKGTITTSLLAQKTEKIVSGEDQYKKVVPTTTDGKILYAINKATIGTKEKENESIKSFRAFIEAGNVLTGVEISGFASPDGAYALNDKLSVNRSKSANKYLRDFLKTNGVEKANDSTFFKRKNVAEDWDGLKAVASKSNFSEKEQLVKIVTTVGDIKAREVEMKKLSSYKKVIAKDILPQLRRSTVLIKGNEKRKADTEISKLAMNSPKELEKEELLYAASLTESKADKRTIYNSFMEIYKDDWRGYNNVAFDMLEDKGDADKIEALLDEANKRSKDNPIVYNNLGVNFRNKGDFANAESYYLLAQSFGMDESLNLGNIKLKQGDYDAAIGYYGASLNCTFNYALANTLTSNYDAATKALGCSTDEAAKFYLMAIVGARNGKTDVMTTNLTKAIAADASYKDMAKNDLEFANYMDSDAFKVAIK
ncbi:MAG: outer membrane protein OmpA-like peptidoglycan-associated protein [Sphingobacteriales bacterium]|jgi:outer membrane protein OmpA-like peptidoglycan-associated protein